MFRLMCRLMYRVHAATMVKMFVMVIIALISAGAARDEDPTIIIQEASRVLLPRKSYIAACVVGKDVHPDDVTEWLVHHLAMGVGHVYWYDHNSSVDISRRVAPFVQAGQLTQMRILEPATHSTTKRNVQLPAYHHCGDMFSTRHEWMLYIDADEFLWVKDAQHEEAAETAEQGVHYALHRLLRKYEAYAGLGVNWLLYGSSGLAQRPTDTMLRSYTRCVSIQEPLYHMRDGHLRHIKILVNTAHLPTPFRFYNPHGGHFVFADDDATTSSSSSSSQQEHVPAPPHVLKARAQRGPIVDELFRPLPESYATVNHTSTHIAVLHYVLRSRQEFEGKVQRGAADGTRKGMNFFDMVDSVAVQDCGVVVLPG